MLKRVLIVEDNVDNMELCTLILKGKFELLTAYNGEEALENIYNESPDLVLLDISLPDMDGLDIVKKIRKDEKLHALPFVALTAHGMKGDRERALSAGCDEYIEKPFEIKELVRVINEQLQKEPELF